MACSPLISGTGEAVNFVLMLPEPTEDETTMSCLPLASLLCEAVSVTRVTIKPSETRRFDTARSPAVGVAVVRNSACGWPKANEPKKHIETARIVVFIRLFVLLTIPGNAF